MTKKPHLIIYIATLTLFMDMMDATILNSALPTLSNIFQLPILKVKNTLIVYMASMAIFLPISAWLKEKLGLKKTLLSAMILFIFSSMGCGLSKNLWVLNGFRFLQGMSAAFSLPLARLLILLTFPREEYFQKMNHVILYSTLGTILGPFIGGVIVQFYSWPWIFWINIPIGLLNIYLLLQIKEIPNDVSHQIPRFDIKGFILLASTLILFIIPITALSEPNAPIFKYCMVLALSFLIGYLYYLYCKKNQASFINLEIFKYPSFKLGLYGGIISRMCLGGIPFLIPLMTQILLNKEPWFSGLLMIPLAAGIIIAKLIAPLINKILTLQQILLINTLAMSTFLIFFSQLNFLNLSQNQFILLIAFGCFQSFQYSSLNAIAYENIPKHLLSYATSVMSIQQQLGIGLGVAICSLILKFFSMNQELYLKTFQYNFLVLGIISICLLCIIIYYQYILKVIKH